MADILCPNCGRSNPDDLEACAYCQASLADAAPAPDSGGDDWISSLRSDDDIYLEEEDQVDWPAQDDDSPTGSVEAERLERIASGPLSDTPSDPEALPEVPVDATARQEQPDWLQDLMQSSAGAEPDPEPEADDEEPAAPAADLPDWMTELNRPEISGDVPEDASEDELAPEPLPDWLTALGGSDAAEDFEQLEPSPQDYTAETPQAGFEPAEDAETGDAEPGWLAGFLEGQEDPLPAPEEPEPADPASPDWLAGFLDDSEDLEQAEEEEADSVLPSWSPAAHEPPREPAAAGTEDDLPPWLGEFETEPASPETAAPFEEMGAFDSAEFEGEMTLPAGEAALPEEEERWDSMDADDGPAPERAEPAEEVPDWLTSALGHVEVDPEEDLTLDPASFALPEPEEPEAETEVDSDLQDWLSNFDQEIDAGEKPEPEPEPDADFPDWLKEVNRGAGSGAEPAGEEGIPDWLRELNEQTTEFEMEGEPTGVDEPEDETDAIDWMPAGAETSAFSMLSEAEGIEEDLAPGELPEWLRAMRPIDVTSPGVMETGESDTGSFERVGPLAGLRGVLSAEPSSAMSGRPPSHSVRLQVSDAQQSKANQLQKMVSAETEPRPAARRAILSEQRVLRYLIAGLLFLTTVIASVIPGRMSELPSKPPEMDAVTPLITGLNPDSAVLIVLDYQPGMSGEMDAVAAGLLDHIMIQGARLALISTSPTGPALGERLVRQVEAVHGYTPGERYANLGYLPGAATGLQLLAGGPVEAVPVGYDARPFWSLADPEGGSPWAQPALQGVTGLGDFAMTLLLSDDPETVRKWVEQVGPSLRPGTLVAAVSAQAAPLVRPYFDSGQITALVSGLRGGAAYEGFLQRDGPARAAWDGVGIGTLAAIVLILGAGTYNLYLVWDARELGRKGGS
jgi:hypothetical protein